MVEVSQGDFGVVRRKSRVQRRYGMPLVHPLIWSGALRSLSSQGVLAKLINAGYLQPEQRNDPDAVTKAIARMKLDLRTGNGSDDPPAA